MNPAIIRTAPSYRAGFTLVEVLIAVVVIAIGLLGLAGLQSTVIANGHVSSLRSIASIHTENMAEMMRANIAGVNANSYVQGTAAGFINYAAIDPTTPPGTGNCRTTGIPCASVAQAQADAYHWIRGIRRDLPVSTVQVAGTVVCNDRDTTDADPCTDGSSHTITVSWQEKDLEIPSMVNKSFATVFRP